MSVRHNGTLATTRRRAAPGTDTQAYRLRVLRSSPMANVFMAGTELVRWDLTACDDDGPYRLVIQHAHGSIVEYFKTPTDALLREVELEELLIAARGGRPLAAEARA